MTRSRSRFETGRDEAVRPRRWVVFGGGWLLLNLLLAAVVLMHGVDPAPTVYVSVACCLLIVVLETTRVDRAQGGGLR